MTVILAATWNPRGEVSRFRRLLPAFQGLYSGVALCLPPGVGAEAIREIESQFSALSSLPYRLVETPDWSWGRYLSLKTGLVLPGAYLQYADFDRLLRWIENHLEELRESICKIPACDCLIFGRTGAAYRTHPQALLQTEAISNRAVSFLVGQEMDVSAGSKGFSRRAVEFLLANSNPGKALGTDGEWPVLLRRGGFRLDYAEVDGLDWESADRYQAQAASSEQQSRAAVAYDSDPRNWARRVEVASEIVECGLDAMRRELSGGIHDSSNSG